MNTAGNTREAYMKYIGQFGKYILLLISLFSKPEKFNVYYREILREMNSVGIGSLGIVCIISIFFGMVSAVQTAAQLLSSIIPHSVIGSITRDSSILEFCPTITCLVLAGRVGSSISSQLGTMRVTEQIDALEIMGINSSGYLILPKIVACVTMIPILVSLSMALSITGGLLAGVLANLVTKQEYIDGITTHFIPRYVFIGLGKAFAYGFIISSVCAYQGFYTQGGALEVGQASTRGVVYSCIAILFFDYLIAQLFI